SSACPSTSAPPLPAPCQLRETSPEQLFGTLSDGTTVTPLERGEIAPTEFRHKRVGKWGMLESVRCDHCEEEFAPDDLVVLAPPAGDGELTCARRIEIMLRRAIAKLPREN